MATRLAHHLAAALLATTLAVPTPAPAQTLTFDFDHSFGDVPSDGPAPWLRAVFQDIGGGVVRLTMSAPGLSTDTGGGAQQPEFAHEWWFNLNPAYSADLLVATPQAGIVAAGIDRPGDPGIGSKLKPDGDGLFSFRFNFGPGALAFGQSSAYDLSVTGVPGLTARDFDHFSTPAGGTTGPFRAAAHIQSTGPLNEGSDFVAPRAIPEPASLALAATAMLGLAFARRRRAGMRAQAQQRGNKV